MKIRIYENENEVNALTEYLTNLFNNCEWSEDERKIFGTADMFDDIDGFYQYELIEDGVIFKNYYVADDIGLDAIDYDNPYIVEATDLTWKGVEEHR